MHWAKRISVGVLLFGLSGCLSPEQSQALYAAGMAMRGGSAAMGDPSYPMMSPIPQAGQMGCVKTGEAVSGFNKLCGYDCMGSANVKVIGAAELCPLAF
jgi:hypothetical protein